MVSVLMEYDVGSGGRSKSRLPPLHRAAKKDDVKSALVLLQNDQNRDRKSIVSIEINEIIPL